MNGEGARPTFVSDAIIVDEVGIEVGIYGGYRLKSSYQPIFERWGASLRPVAVEGLILPYLAGKPVPPVEFFASIPPDDSLFIEGMCRALHLRNYHNIGVEGLELFFNYDPRANRDLQKSIAEIRFMAKRLDEIGLDPGLLVCEITEAAALDPEVLAGLAAEMRNHGIRIAIDDFGAGHSTDERVELVGPDIVKIDGSWFRTLCREPSTLGLFRSLVRAFHRSGTKVLIEGLESAALLGHALASGANLFQGFHLARPALVGTVFDETPLAISDKLGDASTVVPLTGRRITRADR